MGYSFAETTKIQNHEFRTDTIAKRANNYIGLCTANPGKSGDISSEAVIGTNGYARKSIPLSDSWWSAPTLIGSTSQIVNSQNITFNAPSGGSWAGGALFSYFIVCSASSGSNCVASGTIGTPRAVTAADSAPTFGPGSLVHNLTG